MGMKIMWDDGLVQIKLTDNDYIDCSKKEPFYTDWCDTVEQAVDQILQHMEKLQIERFDGNCIPIFQNLIEVKQPIIIKFPEQKQSGFINEWDHNLSQDYGYNLALQDCKRAIKDADTNSQLVIV